MKTHEASSLFPLMEGEAFDALVKDIEQHGQQEPIYRYEGKILDGRNRLRACEKLKLEPWIEELLPKDCPDPFALVMSLNFHRRHLKPHEQGAAMKAALERNGGGRGANKGGRPVKGKPAQSGQVSVSGIAKQLGIPRQTAERHIKAAEDYASLPPVIKKKVDAGDVTVAQAKKVTEKLARSNGSAPEEDDADRAIAKLRKEHKDRRSEEKLYDDGLERMVSWCELWAKRMPKRGWGAMMQGFKIKFNRIRKALEQMEKAK